MAVETFLQTDIVAKFILPFLLIFFLLYAILEKTKILGERHQLNALTSFVVGLIFVGAVFPKIVVGNLILFLTIAIVTMFVGLLLWGFTLGGEPKLSDGIKRLLGIVLIIAVVVAVFWAVGLRVEFLNSTIDFIFYSSWSATFWTNVLFFAAIVGALVLVWTTSKAGK